MADARSRMLRSRGGVFVSNPDVEWELAAGTTLIAIGTDRQLAALSGAASEPASDRS